MWTAAYLRLSLLSLCLSIKAPCSQPYRRGCSSFVGSLPQALWTACGAANRSKWGERYRAKVRRCSLVHRAICHCFDPAFAILPKLACSCHAAPVTAHNPLSDGCSPNGAHAAAAAIHCARAAARAQAAQAVHNGLPASHLCARQRLWQPAQGCHLQGSPKAALIAHKGAPHMPA